MSACVFKNVKGTGVYIIYLHKGKIGQIQSPLRCGSLNISPSWVSLLVSHLCFQLSDCHTLFFFLVRLYTPLLVLGSCITLLLFQMVVCVTSYQFVGTLSHQLYLSFPLSHFFLFFLRVILAKMTRFALLPPGVCIHSSAKPHVKELFPCHTSIVGLSHPLFFSCSFVHTFTSIRLMYHTFIILDGRLCHQLLVCGYIVSLAVFVLSFVKKLTQM